MAETKERKIVSASTGKEVEAGTPKAPTGGEKKSTGGLRAGAIILWLLGIACEVVAILLLNKTIYVQGNATTYMLVASAADFILVVIGSQLWKKANHINPASKKNKSAFFLQNQMGTIVSVIAFLPLIIFTLRDKELDGKTKKLVTIVAAIALVLAGLFSWDFTPASAEDLAAGEAVAATMTGGNVYWTRFGKSYHLDQDCQSLKNSAVLFEGTVDEAFEAGRNDPCDFCALEYVQAELEDAA